MNNYNYFTRRVQTPFVNYGRTDTVSEHIGPFRGVGASGEKALQ